MVEFWKRVIKPKVKRKLKELPKGIAHKRRKAIIKLEERLKRRKIEQRKRKEAFEEAKLKARKEYDKAREEEMIKRARLRGARASKPLGGLRGFAKGMAGEFREISRVYGPPKPKKKGKVKKRKSKKRKSSKRRKKRK